MMLSSPAILPPLKKKQCSIAGIGHFYFAHIGHYHFAGTPLSNEESGAMGRLCIHGEAVRMERA
jgi:hypothetical protein